MAAETVAKERNKPRKRERNLRITVSTKEEESAKEPSELLILLIVITFTERKHHHCKLRFLSFKLPNLVLCL